MSTNLETIELDAVVSEMAADIGAVVQLDPARVKLLLDATGDTSPEFPILRIESGVSRNKRNWTPEVLDDICEQINREEPVGYLGHIKPEDAGYAFPKPQTIWLKAIARMEAGKKVLYVKGYNFPDAEIRGYLKTGVTKEASWRGRAAAKVIGGIQHITKFALESVDWSRKGKAGMSAKVVAIATEMEGVDEDMELSKLTSPELREGNPSLYELIKQEGAAEVSKTVGEMQTKIDEAKADKSVFAKLREVLGIGDDKDIVEAVTEISGKVDEANKTALKDRINAFLTKNIKNDKAKAAVARLLPVSEMEDLSDEDLEKKIGECLEKDDEIKSIVSEMTGPAPLHRREVARTDDDKLKHTKASVKKF
jgi:hypothetical protein